MPLKVAWAGGARHERSLPVVTPVDRQPRAKSGPGGPNSAHATRLHPHETDEPKTAPAIAGSVANRYPVEQASGSKTSSDDLTADHS